ncbi:inorganic phosphate transporter, partial [Christiangramia marina]
GVEKLESEIEDLRDQIFFFIKSLDETSVRGSSFYISILGHLTDIAQSLEYISKKSYKHVNNNHKPLRYNQLLDLKEIDDILSELLTEIEVIFNNREFQDISGVVAKKDVVLQRISEKIEKQVSRTRTEESSPKNTTLYFNLLLETKDLMKAIMSLMEEYNSSYKKV